MPSYLEQQNEIPNNLANYEEPLPVYIDDIYTAKHLTNDEIDTSEIPDSKNMISLSSLPSYQMNNYASKLLSKYQQPPSYGNEISSYSELSSYPEVIRYPNISSYPDISSYQEESSYQDISSYPELSSYPDISSYPEVSSYPDISSYQEESSYPEVLSYPEETSTYQETSSYPEVSSYPEASSYPEESRYLNEISSYQGEVASTNSLPVYVPKVKFFQFLWSKCTLFCI